MNYLLITLGIIFFTILRIIFLRPIYSDSIKVIALFGSLLSFLSTLPLLLFFNKLDLYPHLKLEMQIFSTYNVNLPFGIDGLSIFFVLLVTFLIPLCLLASWNSVFFLEKEYVLSFLILEFILILVFTIRDLLLFFFFLKLL